ncbi:MAG: hypothetical protein ACRBFS_22860 [Aureispira sp.]
MFGKTITKDDHENQMNALKEEHSAALAAVTSDKDALEEKSWAQETKITNLEAEIVTLKAELAEAKNVPPAPAGAHGGKDIHGAAEEGIDDNSPWNQMASELGL